MSSVQSLDRAFDVDLAITYGNKGFIIIRFGIATDNNCKEIDEWINSDAAAVKKFAEIYMVENTDVPELVARYSLSGPCSIIFFLKGSVFRRLSTATINEKRQNKQFSEIANDIRKEYIKSTEGDYINVVQKTKKCEDNTLAENEIKKEYTNGLPKTKKCAENDALVKIGREGFALLDEQMTPKKTRGNWFTGIRSYDEPRIKIMNTGNGSQLLTKEELDFQVGRTAFHHVALAASVKAAKAMVKKNPFLPQLWDMDLQIPLLYADQWRHQSKRKEMLEYLLQVIQLPISLSKSLVQTPTAAGVKQRNLRQSVMLEFVPRTLSTRPDWNHIQLEPDLQNLYRAAMDGKWEIAKAIIDKDQNAKTKEISSLGFTALHVAASCGRWEFVMELVKLLNDQSFKSETKLAALIFITWP